VETPYGRITAVVGAGVFIVAIQGPITGAKAGRAQVARGARIGVIADERVVVVLAAGCRITAVVGAGIGVIAHQRKAPGLASLCIADVIQGAGVVIITGSAVFGVDTATPGNTAVRCTRIVVFTVHSGL
jgi:hypothetical protein